MSCRCCGTRSASEASRSCRSRSSFTGAGAISQLVTRQKALRLEQILCILDVIGVTPTEFFGELYGFDARGPFQDDLTKSSPSKEDLEKQLQVTRGLVESYAQLLVSKRLLDQREVDQVLRRAESPPDDASD